MSVIYSGFAYNLRKFKMLKDMIDNPKSPEDKKQAMLELSRLDHKVHLAWMDTLDWTSGNYFLPNPFREITSDEYELMGDLSGSSPIEFFYAGMNIPNEPEWFGGLASHITIHYEYALVKAHIGFSPHSPEHMQKPVIGKGRIIERSKYQSSIVRYFRIGCTHAWKHVSEESSMCYHVSRCDKCGIVVAVDSSD